MYPIYGMRIHWQLLIELVKNWYHHAFLNPDLHIWEQFWSQCLVDEWINKLFIKISNNPYCPQLDHKLDYEINDTTLTFHVFTLGLYDKLQIPLFQPLPGPNHLPTRVLKYHRFHVSPHVHHFRISIQFQMFVKQANHWIFIKISVLLLQ